MIKHLKIKNLIICIMMLFILIINTGCWDSLDIHRKEIITTIVFDLVDDEIIIYIETANTSMGNINSSGSDCDKYFYTESRSKSLTEMRDNLDQKIDKPIYLSAVRALILSETFAKKYLVEYLYRFKSDENYRKKINTAIIREDPKEMIKIAKEKKDSLGFLVEDIIMTLEELGKNVSRSTMRLLENLSSKYTGILIPCMGTKNASIALIGYSIIKGSEVTDFLPVEDSKGTIYLKQKKALFTYIYPYKDVNYTIEVELKKRKIKPQYDNGEINFQISTEFEATVLYGDKKTPYNLQNDDLKAISDLINTSLTEQLNNAVYLAQNKYDCDYLQFDDNFRIKYPKQFFKMDWNNEFKNINYNIDVKVQTKIDWAVDYSTDEFK